MTARRRPIPRSRKLVYSVCVTLAFFVALELLLAGVAWIVREDRTAGRSARSGSAAEARSGDDPIRVLCLGDSFTYGQYVEREDSYPAQLERLLAEEFALDWRVINGGAPGRSPRGLYRPLARVLDQTKPDLLLLLAGFNGPSDRAILEYEASQGRGGGIDRADRALIRIHSAFLSLRSFRLLRNGLLRWVAEPARLEEAFVPEGYRQATWQRYQEVNQAHLQALVALAEGAGVDVVLLNYPQAPVPENPISDVEYYYVRYLRVSHPKRPLSDADYLFPRARPDEMAINAMIRFTARANDLPLVDLFEAFVDRPDRDALFVAGDEHPNAEGYGVVARAVARALKRQGWLEVETRRGNEGQVDGRRVDR